MKLKHGEKAAIKIFRFDPTKDKTPRYEDFEIPYYDGMTVMGALNYMNLELGGDIAFRWVCSYARCGQCGLMVNGEPSAACLTPVEKEMTIEPLANFPIIRDLVVDRSSVDVRLPEVRPFLERMEIPHAKFPEDVKFNDNDYKLRTCLECHLCSAGCPVFESHPKSFVGPALMLLLSKYASDPRDRMDRSGLAVDKGIYTCTTCRKCTDVCPMELDPMEQIISLRSSVVERGRVPPTLRDALECVSKHGNPWGMSRSKRSEWAKDLKVKNVSKCEKAKLLCFVCCAAAYDSRAQKGSRALVKNLNTLGIDFSILGNEETCCGSEVYNIGEKGLFETLVKTNLDLFDRYGISNIITTSPHCFNAFKNRYGKELAVQHYTQYFADLIDKGKLKFSRKVEKVVTYHDSCYLGKYNNIYDEPRKIIESIPGIKFVELNKSRRRSVCCEGGGGRMWYDVPGKLAERLSETRVMEAIDVGAEILTVACPFCLLTFDDAIKTTGNEDKIQVMDIMALVSEAF